MNRLRILATTATVIALGVWQPSPAAAQARQQRVNPGQRAPAERAGQTRLLLDRFSRRASDALRLDSNGARRLNEELQSFLTERESLTTRRRAVRRELNQLARTTPEDESRIGELLDELMQIQLQEAELNVEEQRRLSEFMTPLQRARLLYLRQRLAQQALQQQDGGPQDRSEPPPRGVRPKDDPDGSSDSPSESEPIGWPPGLSLIGA